MLEKPGTMEAEHYAEEESPTAESVQIPSSLLGGQSATPGDVVRLEIVSVDDESGMLTVKYAAAPKPEKKMGIDSLAAEFD